MKTHTQEKSFDLFRLFAALKVESPIEAKREKLPSKLITEEDIDDGFFHYVNWVESGEEPVDPCYKLRINIDSNHYDQEARKTISDILKTLNIKYEFPLQSFKYVLVTLKEIYASDTPIILELMTHLEKETKQSLSATHRNQFYKNLIARVKDTKKRRSMLKKIDGFLEVLEMDESNLIIIAKEKQDLQILYDSEVRLAKQAQFTLYPLIASEVPSIKFLDFIKELQSELIKNKIVATLNLADTDLPLSEHLSFRQQSESPGCRYVDCTETSEVNRLKQIAAKSVAYQSMAACFPEYKKQRDEYFKTFITEELLEDEDEENLLSNELDGKCEDFSQMVWDSESDEEDIPSSPRPKIA